MSEPLQSLLKKWRVIFFVSSKPEKKSEDPRIRHLLVRSLFDREFCARTIASEALMEPLEVILQEGWEEMKCSIDQMHQVEHLLLSEVGDFGLQAHRQAICNWTRHGPFYSVQALQNIFPKTPAIICGAGPSLRDSLDDLKEIASGTVLFAAGNANVLLSQAGIEPLICCAIDKNTPPASTSLFPESTWCIQGRVSSQSIRVLQSRKIWVPESGSLPWEKGWGLDLSPFDCGWTAGNVATKLALFMGCDPILFVGLDFCQKEQTEQVSISTLNRRNERVWSKNDWLLSAAWQKALCERHLDVRWVNTSFNGLMEIQGGRTLSLQEFKEKESFLQRDCPALLHAVLEQRTVLHNTNHSLQEWQESLRKSLSFCQKRQEGLLEKEKVYRFYLEPLWALWAPLFEKRASDQDLNLHRTLFFENALQQLIHLK